jgi:formiminoglutamase
LKNNFEEALPAAQIAIINTGNRAVYLALKRLCPQQAQRVAYIACSPSNLAERLALCARSGVFTVVLGATPDNMPATPSSVAVIAPAISLEVPYLQRLLQHAPLTDFSALAFQTYLTPALVLEELNGRYFETLRLGAFRSNPVEAELVLCDAEYVWLDLSAVRASDAPSTSHPGPNGLYAEEVCQLGHYIGSSNCAKMLFLFGYKRHIGAASRTAQLIAQLLWHVAEAAASRIYEKIEAGAVLQSGFKEFIVDMDEQEQTLHFVNSLATRRWWMKEPVAKSDAQWVSCLPIDYDTACRGEIPLRWLWHYQKLNYIKMQ